MSTQTADTTVAETVTSTSTPGGVSDTINDDPLGLEDPLPLPEISHLPLPALNNAGHVAHCMRCLDGLPASLVEMDASR
jgi:hypothetical protein